MIRSKPARARSRRTPGVLVASLLFSIVVIAPAAAVLGYPLLAASTAAATIDILRREHRGTAPAAVPDLPPASSPRDRGSALAGDPDRVRQPPGRPAGPPAPGGAAPRDRPQRGAAGEADGVVPPGTTVFDDQIPGVARLDPALLGALRRAATAARTDGVRLYVTSGWRSPAYQQQLLREAISQYGSAEEAARWVGTPTASAHVSGDAVDIGPAEATAWLSRHGAAYGLCRTYRNEPWHFELRPQAAGQGCPPMYADPTHDPRMR